MTPDDAQGEHIAEQVRILCGAYADLLDSLTDAAREIEGPGKLAAVERALGAVVRFVQGDPAAFAAGAHLPLIALARAVHDVKAGAKPQLFEGRAAQNRPAGDAFSAARGQAAAAVVILEDAGMQPAEAAKVVAAEMARAGVAQPGGKNVRGKPVAARLLLDWREALRNPDDNKVPAPMRQAFHAAVTAELRRQQQHGRGEPGTPETVAAAKAHARALVAVLASWFPPSGKGAC